MEERAPISWLVDQIKNTNNSNDVCGRNATATPTWISPFIISNDITLKRDVYDHLLKQSQTF